MVEDDYLSLVKLVERLRSQANDEAAEQEREAKRVADAHEVLAALRLHADMYGAERSIFQSLGAGPVMEVEPPGAFRFRWRLVVKEKAEVNWLPTNGSLTLEDQHVEYVLDRQSGEYRFPGEATWAAAVDALSRAISQHSADLSAVWGSPTQRLLRVAVAVLRAYEIDGRVERYKEVEQQISAERHAFLLATDKDYQLENARKRIQDEGKDRRTVLDLQKGEVKRLGKGGQLKINNYQHFCLRLREKYPDLGEYPSESVE